MPALTYVYGATIAIGGIFTYQAKGSKGALGWGLLFGTLLCWAALRMKERGPGVRGYPFVIALLVSVIMFGMTAARVHRTGKIWPMGALAALSLIMGMRYASHFTIYGDLYEYEI
ncbi:hypothetical protein GUITHDRAFT_152046 [Guillardia theta CCMP2712]|uniref:Uncharacterized protein n=2 Tax=Guillardia theta TaxID=55529 RepID=L1JGM9_GUITC|nr:hypothetical protein GUITHDRAFT_152046 [Guillardia theta CCMP2712]EKX47661.1 hypothetical protein GUITHDRAFT_152046 [Guillardia theta CCMP2712]|eukprot:XP_005834641.1 hypothetical protein GUITHDRAFT_152046 [Guillardia theta CCMP2712]